MKNYNNSSGRSQMANRLLELAKLGRPGGLYEKFYKDTADYLITSCINDTGLTCNIADDIKKVSVDSPILTRERELLEWLKQVSTDLATSPSVSVKKIVCQDFNDKFEKLSNTFSESINHPVAVGNKVAEMYFDPAKLPRISYDLLPDSSGITFTGDYSKQLLNLLSTSVYADKNIALSLFEDADIYRKFLDGADAGGMPFTMEFVELSFIEKQVYFSYDKNENKLTYHGKLRVNESSGGMMIDGSYTSSESADFLRKNLR
jgi:hypothetical protein